MVAVAYPSIYTVSSIFHDGGAAIAMLHESAVWSIVSIPGLLLATTIWGTAIAISATVLALPVSFYLAGTSSPRKRRIVTALTIGVLCIPPYISYWIWGLIRLPGSMLGDYVAHSSPAMHEFAGIVQLWWGLTIWVWPIPALTIAGALGRIPRSRSDLLTLDAAGRFRKFIIIINEARSGVFLGLFLSFLAVISAAVVFDLASTQTSGLTTYSEALRRLHGEIPDQTAILVASLPFAILMAFIAIFAVRFLATPPREANLCTISISRAVPWSTLFIVMIAVFSPILIMLRTLGFSIRPFVELSKTDGSSLVDGFILASGAGVVFFVLTLGFSFAWHYAARSRILKMVLIIQAIVWVYISLLPGMTIGSALVHTYNHPMMNLIYHSPIIVVLGYAARFGFLPMLTAHWFAVNHAKGLENLAAIDGAREFPDWLVAVGPSAVRTAIATGFIGIFLSLGEITTTILVTPPSIQSPAERLLNRLHYAREDAAMATCLIITLVVFIGGTLAALAFTRTRENHFIDQSS